MSSELPSIHYSPPVLPAITAASINYIYYWMVPYWIVEFILYCIKDHLITDGVASVDWVWLFFFLVAEPTSLYFGMKTLRLPSWENVVLYLICAILSIFFTMWFILFSNVILFIEYIFGIITLIFEIIQALFVLISCGILHRPQRIVNSDIPVSNE